MKLDQTFLLHLYTLHTHTHTCDQILSNIIRYNFEQYIKCFPNEKSIIIIFEIQSNVWPIFLSGYKVRISVSWLRRWEGREQRRRRRDHLTLLSLWLCPQLHLSPLDSSSWGLFGETHKKNNLVQREKEGDVEIKKEKWKKEKRPISRNVIHQSLCWAHRNCHTQKIAKRKMTKKQSQKVGGKTFVNSSTLISLHRRVVQFIGRGFETLTCKSELFIWVLFLKYSFGIFLGSWNYTENKCLIEKQWIKKNKWEKINYAKAGFWLLFLKPTVNPWVHLANYLWFLLYEKAAQIINLFFFIMNNKAILLPNYRKKQKSKCKI